MKEAKPQRIKLVSLHLQAVSRDKVDGWRLLGTAVAENMFDLHRDRHSEGKALSARGDSGGCTVGVLVTLNSSL